MCTRLYLLSGGVFFLLVSYVVVGGAATAGMERPAGDRLLSGRVEAGSYYRVEGWPPVTATGSGRY